MSAERSLDELRMCPCKHGNTDRMLSFIHPLDEPFEALLAIWEEEKGVLLLAVG